MRIRSLVFRPGDRSISNDELAEQVVASSRPLGAADERRIRRRLSRLLSYVGARGRYWTSDDGAVRDAVAGAIEEALAAASLSPGDIDVLISTSVDRAVLEPAQAAVIANLAGMFDCSAFDVLEGCNGWLRGAQIAQALLETDGAQRVLLVSAEFTTSEGGAIRPDQYRVSSLADLRRRFPAMTIGDGVAVTILEPGDTPWRFSFSARSDLLPLCYATLPTGRRYVADEARGAWPDGIGFVADGPGLFHHADRSLHELAARDAIDLGGFDEVVVHAATGRRWDEGFQEYGVARVRNVFPDFGNVVSASIPAGLTTIDPTPGPRRVLAAGASAGMSFALARFSFDPTVIVPPARRPAG